MVFFRNWREYVATCARSTVYFSTLLVFGCACLGAVLWASPELRKAGTSWFMLLLTILAILVLLCIPITSERVGVIPYEQFKSFICFYRLSYPFMLLGLLFLFLGYGTLVAQGSMVQEKYKGFGVKVDELWETGQFGDYFHAVDGYVATNLTRVMVRTASLHRLREGDELYKKPRAATEKDACYPECPELVDLNPITKFHQLQPPPIDGTVMASPATIPPKDVQAVLAIAPVFREGEFCLSRYPPTNQICADRNTVVAFAVKFAEDACRDLGFATCATSNDMLGVYTAIDPQYRCHRSYNQVEPPAMKGNRRYDGGVCGRIVEPQGFDRLLLASAIERFVEDGWALDPKLVAGGPFLAVDYDECVSNPEQCQHRYESLGMAGLACSGFAAFLIAFTCAVDIYHDYLLVSIADIRKFEDAHARKVREAARKDVERVNLTAAQSGALPTGMPPGFPAAF